MTWDSDVDQLDICVAGALRLLETGDARSVQVLTGTRPTYQQLKGVREACEGRGFALKVLGTGGFVITREPIDTAALTSTAATPGPKRHHNGWFDHLLEMREGVR